MRVMRRHTGLKIFLAILGVLLVFAAVYAVRFAIHKYEPETYGSYTIEGKEFDLSLFPSLTVEEGTESLRIMQLADPQLKFGFMTHDKKTLDLIDRALKTQKPHICVVTGDLTMSLFTYDAYKHFADFMEERKQYWTLTFGNHDLEFDSSAYTLWQMLSEYEYCLFDVGPSDVKGNSNFIIPVYRGESDVPDYALILMDSGMYPEGGGGLSWIYDSFDQSQLDFYKWAIEGLKQSRADIQTSLFFHIPIQEHAMMYYSAFGDESSRIDTDPLLPTRDVEGTICENDKDTEECVDEGYTVGIYYQGENTGLYDLALSLGSTRAMFVGHDHANTLRGYYGDIYLAYGRCTGYHTYPLFEKANFLTNLLGVSDDIYFNMEMWQDENGTPYEKGVLLIDISLSNESYGEMTVTEKGDSELQ